MFPRRNRAHVGLRGFILGFFSDQQVRSLYLMKRHNLSFGEIGIEKETLFY